MKTIHRFPRFLGSFFAPITCAPGQKLLLCLALMSVFSLGSCFLHYYKTNTEQQKDAALLQDLMKSQKFFILHSGSSQQALSEIKMNNGKVEAVIEPLPPEHKKYLRPANFQKNRFPVKEREIVLREVHLYTHEAVSGKSLLSLPLSSFYRIDIYELNEQATKHSQIASTIGLVLGTAGVIAIIIAASSFDIEGTSSSPSTTESVTCSPQVYAGIGENQSLAGILYSGAIFAPLKRTDYLPLQTADALNGSFHLRLRGGQHEELFVQDTRLLEVTHPADHAVLIDQKGRIVTYRSPATSRKATIGDQEDVSEAIRTKDDRSYSFTNDPDGEAASNVILDFKKPFGATKGKLVISAKNSTWATYLFRKYKALYGEYYAKLQEQKDKADPQKLLQCELDQSLPLSVSVRVGDRWKLVDFFYTPGNQVWRDMIMEIDLSAVAKSKHVQVKLETTYMFWDLDYAGMDFSEGISYTERIAKVKLAKMNAFTGIQETDPTGTIHLSEDEYLDMQFAVSQTTGVGQTNSYFLAGTGYYHDNTKYEGKVQLANLTRFSRKGAFDQFSRESFNEFAAMFRTTDPTRLTAKQ